jgi:hypothetical protein
MEYAKLCKSMHLSNVRYSAMQGVFPAEAGGRRRLGQVPEAI